MVGDEMLELLDPGWVAEVALVMELGPAVAVPVPVRLEEGVADGCTFSEECQLPMHPSSMLDTQNDLLAISRLCDDLN